MANKVLIDIMNSNNKDAGTKARNDVAAILKKMDYEQVVMLDRNHSNWVRVIEVLLATSKLHYGLEDNDSVVLQYPYNSSVMKIVIAKIKRIKKRKKIKFVILIHDVPYLREGKKDASSIQEEVAFLNSADSIIVHNSAMEKELRTAGVDCPMYRIGLFDYLYDGKPATIANSEKPVIVFAGNLSKQKSGFIYSYDGDDNVEFNLYGTMPEKTSSCYNYKGSFAPDELIGAMEGNYGLVWDGPEVDSCSGKFGNYLRYNNPHKLSLYIAAGLPVIVWNEAALADFVRNDGIGLAISSLSELGSVPKANDEKYIQMLENVNRYGQRIRNGEMLRTVMEELV